METNLISKVYDFINHFIHPNDIKLSAEKNRFNSSEKICPVTGLDISMQPKNSKFLSSSGVKWYYDNDKRTFDSVLAVRISGELKSIDMNKQFRKIAHNIRNEESNPRNNTKRAIQKILDEKDSLFNNMQLIDKRKLKEAGMHTNS